MAIRPVSTSASTIFDQAREGMGRGERKLRAASAAISKGDFGLDPIVEMASAESTYQANAKVVRAHHEMLGNLLETKR